MGFVSNMKFGVGKAEVKNDSSFAVTLNFDNVIGAPQAVDTINAAVNTISCPNGFNSWQLGMSVASLAGTIYSAVKSAKDNK